MSPIDFSVRAEIDKFEVIKQGTPSNDNENFSLTRFWADHKSALPLHFSVYVAEVGCKKAANAIC
jgi:hypothetical protein